MQARLIDVPGAERQAPAPQAAWHTLSAEEVLRAEEADPRHGLSSSAPPARSRSGVEPADDSSPTGGRESSRA